MIVVDTNILAYLYLPSDYTELAEKLLAQDGKWVAPVLWRSEFRNVLTLYLRKKHLTFKQMMAIMAEAESLLDNREFELKSQEVMRLVASSTCSAYDCEFVALAERLGVKLITMDRKVLQQFPDLTQALTDIAH
jgi:predicted nucleic acid-binding protein